MKRERGFTLIEALIALGIAATALVILVGRLGASADIQRRLAYHAVALDVACNELARLVVGDSAARPIQPAAEQSGVVEVDGISLNWRSWTEKTMLDGFVRQNIAVSVPGEEETTLFLYQEIH